MTSRLVAFALLAAACAGPLAAQVHMAPGIILSDESGTGSYPGQEASKVKLVGLTNTPGGALDGRMIVTYADAGYAGLVWEPKGLEHAPSDIFVRYSDDGGISWSAPVNVSRTAHLHSASTDWDGDGVDEIYWGDSDKPTIFNHGLNVVVIWADKYVPEETWTWGQVGDNTVQGRAEYPDLATYPNYRVVPFSAQYCAISNDGGTTWIYGDVNPPLQLTYGRRDVAGNGGVRGVGGRWNLTWQEDPDGLQTGEAEGPGEGASGANTSKGTDVWYTWTSDIVADPMALRTNRVPLTNNSSYDLSNNNGFPTVGAAGQIENHAASRPNLLLMNVGGGVYKAVVAYEETKGIDVLTGKTVQLHVFQYDLPQLFGTQNNAFGSAGTQLTNLLENSRRVRLLSQQPNGVDPALVVFWRQGVGDEGASADVMVRLSTTVDEASVAAAPLVNLSSYTETATSANLSDSTSLNPIENALAHRGVLRGPMLVLGYCYTPNGPLARYTDLENYDFWVRRSLDGGATWLAPQNVTNLATTTINVKEPRIVGPPNTAGSDPATFVIAWGTETNVYEGIGTIVPLDMFLTRTTDQGATFEPITPLTATPAAEYESQIRVNGDCSRVYAVWNSHDSAIDSMFAIGGNPLRVEAPAAPVAIGETAPLILHAPGYEGALYVAGCALGITPGIATPFGSIALNNDELLLATLGVTSPYLAGFLGFVPTDGQAPASILIPNEPELVGITLYANFATFPAIGPWGLAAPGKVTID
ncbi:MAG: exo-alpha-sialidase [Planctomycetes bacterium]|nr:exo-alpha-sialidase [Planctomycetota bacterium]